MLGEKLGLLLIISLIFFFFQAEDGIRDYKVTGVQTCALPISDQCAHAPSQLAPESSSGPLAPARCGASPDTAAADRSGPAAPASAHPADRLSCGSPRSAAPCAH